MEAYRYWNGLIRYLKRRWTSAVPGCDAYAIKVTS